MKTRNIEDVQLDFLISALSHGNFISTTDILMWMKQQNEDVVSNIKQIPIEQLKGGTIVMIVFAMIAVNSLVLMVFTS